MPISIECIQLNSDIIVKDCESTDHPIAQELVIRSFSGAQRICKTLP
jgi:hypothetical protein